jgi:hypothetical protein
VGAENVPGKEAAKKKTGNAVATRAAYNPMKPLAKKGTEMRHRQVVRAHAAAKQIKACPRTNANGEQRLKL